MQAMRNNEGNLLLDVINVPYAVTVVSHPTALATLYPGKVSKLRIPFTQGIVGNFVLIVTFLNTKTTE